MDIFSTFSLTSGFTNLPRRLSEEEIRHGENLVVWNILQFAPVGWRSVHFEFRAVGLHVEADAEVESLDGSRGPWELPEPVINLISGLRLGMRSAAGAWHRLDATVEFPNAVKSWEYDWEGEPGFRTHCPVGEYRRELRGVYTAGVREYPEWVETRTALPKNELSVRTWVPAEGVRPATEPEPPVLVTGRLPEGVAAALVPLLPEGWETASYDVQVLGSVQEHQLVASLGDGTEQHPEIPLSLVEAVATHRRADHTRERGAWLAASFVLRRDGGESSMRLDYTTRPAWQEEIPDDAYSEELWFFPRADEAIPTWLRWRAGLPLDESAMPAAPTGPELKLTHETSRLVAEDESFDPPRPEEIEPLLAFLRGGAAVLSSASGNKDLLFPDRSDHVPLGYRTDGTWIWSEEAAYYLELDECPPQPGLLTHIRRRNYTAPEVSPEVLTNAYTQLIHWIEGPFFRARRTTPGATPESERTDDHG